MNYFFQQLLNGFQLGSVYALISLGYTMIYGIIRLINFAHGDIFMLGAYFGFYAITRFKFNFFIAILFSMVLCMIINVLIEKIAYAPLRKKNVPRINLLITAIGVSFFLENFASLKIIFGPDYLPYPRPFKIITFDFLGLTLSSIQIIVFFITLVLLLILDYLIKRTKIGLAMRAVSYDKETALLMGINVDNIISLTFALGAALAGAGGVLYGICYPQIHPFMGIMPGLKAFVAAVLGGIGVISGAVLGSYIIGMIEVFTAAFISSTFRDAIAFAILIIVLLTRPQGLFGKEEGIKL
ncbi:MAG: branched-chain amino acid ABC transporter permease [candidate division WOR-3 bacterium]|nr:branched-chain amino acid ABC transporter permease [candidate division WOR-3 bacterium]MCX7837074.1 branched-chain amino acid ABC transporter permease [candidate division WOR-3 bacterium]MDW8114239.1 branched-chain amino acid ABC transporter permease [candidate division WOR-3 bacterium]